MANIVETQKLIDTNKRTLLKVVLISDATATANSTLISFNELAYAINANGAISNTDPQLAYDLSVKRIYGYSTMQNAAGHATLRWISDANNIIVGFKTGQFDFNLSGESGDNAVIKSAAANTSGLGLTLISPTSGDVITLFVDMKKQGPGFDQGQTADPAAFNYGGWNIV